MHHVTKSRSGLLLIELILAILFFALGSAVCIHIFAQAYLDSRNARNLSFASVQVSSAASVIRHTDGSADAVSEYYPHAQESDGELLIFYNQEQQPCSSPDAVYTLRIHTDRSGIRETSVLTMTGNNGDTLYELEIHYPAANGEVLP